jgi:hypothetical protein
MTRGWTVTMMLGMSLLLRLGTAHASADEATER